MHRGEFEPELNGATAETVHSERNAPGVRYQELFEFSLDVQLVTDGLGIILEANSFAADLFRCPREFLLGKPLALFGTAMRRSRFYDSLTRLLKGIAVDSFETQLTRRWEGPREISVLARKMLPPSDRFTSATEFSIHWVIRDITAWKRSESARAELQRRLATAQEDERRRFARDLHDTSSQLLTALALSVRAVRDAGPLPATTRERLDHVQKLTDDLAQQIHDLAARLRPASLDDLGLEAALRQLVANWSMRTGVETDFHAAGLARRRFPPEVETTLFRVVQEALTNIAKHAGARRVAVAIGPSDGKAVAVIEDDGIGFDPENIYQTPTPDRPTETRSRLGLLGMQERAHLMGGTFEIESAPGQGTTIIVRLPLVCESSR